MPGEHWHWKAAVSWVAGVVRARVHAWMQFSKLQLKRRQPANFPGRVLMWMCRCFFHAQLPHIRGRFVSSARTQSCWAGSCLSPEATEEVAVG